MIANIFKIWFLCRHKKEENTFDKIGYKRFIIKTVHKPLFISVSEPKWVTYNSIS